MRQRHISSGWSFCFSCFADPEWRDKFLGIDAESHGRVTAFFIERKLKELRKIGLKRSQLSQEEPVADCLLGKGLSRNDVIGPY